MISKLLEAMFTPKYPRGYTGRHRAESALAGNRTGETRTAAMVSREATV